MDPMACLNSVESLLSTGDLTTALDTLMKYNAWRSRGGYEPEGGDRRSFELRASIRNAFRRRLIKA